MKPLEFYINKFKYLDNDIDVSFIPPILKRRLSLLDKTALTVLKQTISDDVEYLLFSSQYGQIDRLNKIIEQYKSEQETSPNLFSCSVHNYSLGFFLLNIKKTVPYTALSSYKNSIAEGILAAVISKYDNTLFCYADANNGITNAFALNMSKAPSQNGVKYILKQEQNNISDESYDNFIKLFCGNIDYIKTQNYTIERA